MLLWNICETKLQTHCPRSGVLGYLQQQRTYCLSRQLPLQAGIPHCSSAPCASLNLVLPILAIESNSKSTPGWLSPQCLRRPVSCLILSIFSDIALSVPLEALRVMGCFRTPPTSPLHVSLSDFCPESNTLPLTQVRR